MNFQCSYQCQQSHGLFFTFIIFWPFKMEESFTDWCWNNCILIVEVHLKWLTHLNRQDNMKMSRVCFYFSKCKVLDDGFQEAMWLYDEGLHKSRTMLLSISMHPSSHLQRWEWEVTYVTVGLEPTYFLVLWNLYQLCEKVLGNDWRMMIFGVSVHVHNENSCHT